MDSEFRIGSFVRYGSSVGRIVAFSTLNNVVKGADVQWLDDSTSWVELRMLRSAQQVLPQGKPDYTLLPWDILEEVAKVFQVGADKYGRDNWVDENNGGGDHLAAALQHIVAHMRGEILEDPASGGSGLRHLSHATARLLMVVGKEMRQ